MKVVYPLTIQHDYTELRFSLRSIEKYLKPPFEVVIVGDYVPEWINNCTQIHLPDVPGQRNLSVRRKVLAALEYGGDIFFMNDDFYLLHETNPKKFPYYSTGELKGKGETGAKALFTQLEKLGKPTKYYGHYPALYKKDFKEIIKTFSNDCITKSAYCNFVEIESTEVSDCKILTAQKPDVIREFIKDKVCFSTGSYSLKSALPILQELFPKPSIYEI